MDIAGDQLQDAALQYLVSPIDASQISDGIDGSSHGMSFDVS